MKRTAMTLACLFLVLLLLPLFGSPAQASDTYTSVDGKWLFDYDSMGGTATATIRGYLGTDAIAEIPSTISNGTYTFPVKSIGNRAFENNTIL